jgi:putative protease
MSLELVCPAGNLPALKIAVDNGADCVYMGFKDNTNARAFAGLNFDQASALEGVRYAHGKGAKVLLALNTPSPTSGSAGSERWTTRWNWASMPSSWPIPA